MVIIVIIRDESSPALHYTPSLPSMVPLYIWMIKGKMNRKMHPGAYNSHGLRPVSVSDLQVIAGKARLRWVVSVLVVRPSKIIFLI